MAIFRRGTAMGDTKTDFSFSAAVGGACTSAVPSGWNFSLHLLQLFLAMLPCCVHVDASTQLPFASSSSASVGASAHERGEAQLCSF